MVGGIDIQADHVGGLRFEVGIVRLHVALESMGLKAGALPSFRDEVVMNLQHAAEFPGTPVRTAVGRRLPRLARVSSLSRSNSELPLNLRGAHRARSRAQIHKL